MQSHKVSRTVKNFDFAHKNWYTQYLLRKAIHTMSQQDFTPAPKLGLSDINSNTIEAKYAVRGKIPSRAEELRQLLQKDPSSLPFSKVIQANIGNPQQLDQKPLTFYRNVLSLLQNPELLQNKDIVAQFPEDVVERAKSFLGDAKSMGAYSNSQGVEFARKSVAKFLERRDGFAADPKDVFLTTGASAAVEYILKTICSGPKTGVLIPIPQYPLYTALLALLGSKPLPYYLKEENGWSMDVAELEKIVQGADVVPRILVVINPGNPTGAVLKSAEIASVITLAAKHGIVIIADEVYQENVYKGEFVSFRKVLKQLQAENWDLYKNVQLASLHSVSKGVSGECGQRAGYMELLGFTDEIRAIFTKMVSISLCSVVSGQAVLEMMVNPPKEGDASFEVDQQERKQIFESLQQRAKYLRSAFDRMEDVECQDAEGAMYLFPKLKLSAKAVSAARAKNLQPDEYYCMELLENTGICTVPGSGFGQVEGTYHLRTTFLPPGVEWINDWEKFHKDFVKSHA